MCAFSLVFVLVLGFGFQFWMLLWSLYYSATWLRRWRWRWMAMMTMTIRGRCGERGRCRKKWMSRWLLYYIENYTIYVYKSTQHSTLYTLVERCVYAYMHTHTPYICCMNREKRPNTISIPVFIFIAFRCFCPLWPPFATPDFVLELLVFFWFGFGFMFSRWNEKKRKSQFFRTRH